MTTSQTPSSPRRRGSFSPLQQVSKKIPAFAGMKVFFGSVALAAEGHSAGLPQLDPTYYPSQIFWLLVHFVVLYAVMTMLVLPRLNAILNERQGKLAADLNTAEKSQKEAEAAQKTYEAALASARQKAHTLRQETLAEAAKQATVAEQKLAEALAIRANAANERIKTATAALHARLRDVASEAVTPIVSKIGGLEADKASVDAAVSRVFDGALKEVA